VKKSQASYGVGFWDLFLERTNAINTSTCRQPTCMFCCMELFCYISLHGKRTDSNHDRFVSFCSFGLILSAVYTY